MPARISAGWIIIAYLLVDAFISLIRLCFIDGLKQEIESGQD
jgi:hypothetical protein